MTKIGRITQLFRSEMLKWNVSIRQHDSSRLCDPN